MTQEQIFFKYTRSAAKDNNARFMAFYRDSTACWFDDYKEAVDEFSLFSETTSIGCLWFFKDVELALELKKPQPAHALRI